MYRKTIILLSFIVLSSCSLNINLNQPQSISPTPINDSTSVEEAETPINTPASMVSIEEQLAIFFADKFSKPKDEVVLTISQNTGTHALGGIKFSQEMGGGMWLAHNDNGNWIVDYDGNGMIACQQVEPFNYPPSIITECWDETTNNTKQL